MAEYALFINGEFREIRYLPERPDDIPHKQMTWHNVVRREAASAFTGLESGVWVIQTVDPATLPPAVPGSITRRQCALQLRALQVITLQEALDMVKTATVPAAIAAIFAKMPEEPRLLAEIDFAASRYYRNNSLLGMMGLTEEQIDQFFIAASDL